MSPLLAGTPRTPPHYGMSDSDHDDDARDGRKRRSGAVLVRPQNCCPLDRSRAIPRDSIVSLGPISTLPGRSSRSCYSYTKYLSQHDPTFLKTDPDPPPHPHQSDSDGRDDQPDPKDPWGDGFGEDLMGDETDRDALSKMTELEREELLAERKDVRAQTLDRKRIIEMAREKKQREAPGGGGGKRFKQSDADALTGRKSKRVAGEEQARGGTSKSKALADIARKKERRVGAGGSDEDDDDDDSDEYGSGSEEDEGLDGILPTREKRAPARRRGGQRGESDSDSDDSDDEDGVGDNVPASEAQIRRIFLKRSTMEKWIAEPFLKSHVPGCMVRVGIGIDNKTGDNRYRVAEIVDVVSEKHGKYVLEPYEIVPTAQRNSPATPFWLLLKFGDNQRAFRLSELSNGEPRYVLYFPNPNTVCRLSRVITHTHYERLTLFLYNPSGREFSEWQAAARETNQKPLRLKNVNASVANITAAENYRYTSEDVHTMLRVKNEKKGGMTHNLANQKEVLRRLIERAKAEGDDDAVAQLSAQYTEVVERLTVKLDKGGTQAIMAEINKKNNAINDANLSRTAAEAVARAKSGKKDESMNDPFSRRPTRMVSISHLPHSAD